MKFVVYRENIYMISKKKETIHLYYKSKFLVSLTLGITTLRAYLYQNLRL
jgi:hypothetical protein